MKLTLLLFLALICVSAVTAGRFTDRQKWLRFKTRHNKVYADDEARFTVFRDNLRAVEKLNREEAKSGGSAKFGITKFMDLTPEEFRTAYLMPKGLFNELPNGTVAAPKSTGSIPTSFDWRDNATPVISAVKNQEQCGSCWAFSATEEIESFWALAGNTLTDLSPQQIVSCDTTADGCNGGWTYLAYQYVESAGGIESESDYPYKAVTGKCEFNSADVVAKISGWSYVTQSKDETVMATFMATTGPISVCVDAASWQYYTSGVLKRCGTEIDHCVQAVGYSVDSTNTPYWIVRNSWGTDWGIEGYIYVYRGADTCAIAQVATSVTAA